MNRIGFYQTMLVILLIALPISAQTVKSKRTKSGVKKVVPVKTEQPVVDDPLIEKTPADRITIHELKRKMDRKEDLVIIDTRAGSSYLGSTVRIKGAIHITLDELEARMSDLPRDKEIITYCT